MTETQEQILGEARHYVTDVFTNKVNPELVFHTLDHTEDVAEACSRMADHYQIKDEERFILMLAAWFHDTGYSLGTGAGHEEESVKIVTEFLRQHNIDDATIHKVSSCIHATRMPQSPVTLIEKILCDADLFHLSTEDFKARNQLLKQEQETLLRVKIAKKDWKKNNIQFLETHKYFTDYGQNILEPQKQENLASLQKKKRKKEEEAEEEEYFPYVYEDSFNSNSKKAREQQKDTERGIQTMFRTTSNNHFQLSSLADGKGNIMISINSIILSISLTILLPRLAHYPHYIIPALIFIVSCLGSIIFGILATRPTVNKGRFTEEDIRQKKTNLLFFGNFHSMQLDEYQWAMNEMLKDREYLYNSMIKDIYFLGVVLAKKYKRLRISYTIFMWGLIVAVIAFAFASIGLFGGVNAGSSLQMIDY